MTTDECDHNWIRPEDTRYIQWGDYRYCDKCGMIAIPNQPLPRCRRVSMTTVKRYDPIVQYDSPALEQCSDGDLVRYEDYEKLQQRITGAVEMAMEYGHIDGAHHKMWVIDQMMRNLLTEDQYQTEIACFEAGDDGKPWYEWDEGIPP